MNKTTKKVLRTAIPILLAVFFGWYTFSKLPIDEIIPYFKSARYGWILLGVFLGLLSHLSRAYRWQYLLEPLGYTVKLPNSVMSVFIAYLANYGIPRSGEVLRAAVLTNYEEVPFEKSFGTIVAERLADMVVMMIIIGITLLIEFNFIFELLTKNIDPKRLFIVGSIGLFSFAILIYLIRRSTSIIALKIKSFLKGLLEGVTSIFRMRHKWKFIFHTFFIWAMYVAMFYVTSLALPELSTVTLGAILIAFIAASFTIAATNGGIFFYPAAVMAAFLLFKLPEDASYAFGWIMWTSQTLLIIIGGILSFVYLPIYNKKRLLGKKNASDN